MLHDRPPPLTRKRAPTMNPARHMSREIRTSGAVYSEVTYSEQCGVCHYWAEIQGPLTHQHKKTNRSLHKTDAGRRIPVSYLERPVPLAVSYADGRSHYGGGGLLNRTYGTHKNLDISTFSPTIFGPIYLGSPSNKKKKILRVHRAPLPSVSAI